MEQNIQYKVVRPIQNYSDLRLHNLKLTYDAIHNKEPISRAALAQETGLTATSMTRICSTLLDSGLIQAAQAQTLRRSTAQRSYPLCICKDAYYGYCITIDTDVCRCAITNLACERIATQDFYAFPNMSHIQILGYAKRVLHSLLNSVNMDERQISAMAISIVGTVSDGFVYFSPQFNWNNLPLKSYAENLFGIPAIIENDCRAALIGECDIRYRGTPPANICYLTINRTGMGSAAIINGELLRGSRNMAGELGHTTVDVDGILCDCGRKGCLQTFFVEKYIVRRANMIDPKITSFPALLDAVANKAGGIDGLVRDTAKHMALTLNLIICAYNPDVIIINDTYYLNTYQNWLHTYTEYMSSSIYQPARDTTTLLGSKLGMDASLYGISCILKDEVIRKKLSEIVDDVPTESRES